jgi:SAM-dependent methyltransferase
MAHVNNKESSPPMPNRPPGNKAKDKLLFILRQVADLQVASVFRHLKPWLAALSGEVLEVGCGAQPYRHLIPESCHYRGLDWQGAEKHFQYRTNDTIYYSGEQFPFADHTFDYLFHTEVMEHVYDLNLFLKECCRVLKPDGGFLCTIPFQARYHYIPFDFWRLTPAALQRIFTETGFQYIQVIPRGNDLTVAAYKVIGVLFRWAQGNWWDKIIALCCLPIGIIALIIGHLAMYFNWGSSDDCLGYTVTAKAGT